MLDDTLEDAHLCIKCNATIIGLEEYVRHRKDNCAGPSEATKRTEKTTYYSNKDDHQSYPIHNFDYDLGADLFFSSLELQSSSKKPPPIVPPQLVSNVQLDTSSQLKKVTPPKKQHSSETDWMTKSAKLIHDENEIGDAKEVDSSFNYYEDEEDEENESEGDADADGNESEEEFDNIPPRHHTGGKWKPENRPSSTLFRTSSGWGHSWKYSDRLDKSFESMYGDNEPTKGYSPPPDHTKGKWVPGTKITKLEYEKPREITSQKQKYWCSSCNRQLASKLVYDRHVKSNLHQKRLQEENDLETGLCPIFEPAAAPSLSSSRVVKPSIFTNETIYTRNLKRRQSKSGSNEVEVKHKVPLSKSSKRIRRKYYTICHVCKMRLQIKLLGKHLTSHYHYRRMQKAVNPYDMILEHIEKIVVQCPFQCQSCHFYTNLQENFFNHWYSEEHRSLMLKGPGQFMCSFCKVTCLTLDDMTVHLLSDEHQEAVLTVNRSVPVIILKISPIICPSCDQSFRFNFELKRHDCISSVPAIITFVCDECQKSFKSRLALQKHESFEHAKLRFFCSVCEFEFDSALAAKKHRRTTEHKVKSARLRGKSSNELVEKVCKVCSAVFEDILKLKDHLRTQHSDIKYSCPHCGESFVLPQELSRHVRDKRCNFFTNLSSIVTEPSGEKQMKRQTMANKQTSGQFHLRHHQLDKRSDRGNGNKKNKNVDRVGDRIGTTPNADDDDTVDNITGEEVIGVREREVVAHIVVTKTTIPCRDTFAYYVTATTTTTNAPLSTTHPSLCGSSINTATSSSPMTTMADVAFSRKSCDDANTVDIDGTIENRKVMPTPITFSTLNTTASSTSVPVFTSTYPLNPMNVMKHGVTVLSGTRGTTNTSTSSISRRRMDNDVEGDRKRPDLKSIELMENYSSTFRGATVVVGDTQNNDYIDDDDDDNVVAVVVVRDDGKDNNRMGPATDKDVSNEGVVESSDGSIETGEKVIEESSGVGTILTEIGTTTTQSLNEIYFSIPAGTSTTLSTTVTTGDASSSRRNVCGTSNNNGIYVDEIEGSIAEKGNTEITWKCKLCSFGTSSQSELTYHRILHSITPSMADETESDTKNCVVKIECPYCKRAYRKASLRAHLRIHTNERIYPCDQCDWSFARLSNLKNHIKNIHNKKGDNGTVKSAQQEVVYSCGVCEKGFKNRHLLSQHMCVHRYEMDDIMAGKMIKCGHEDGCCYTGRSVAEVNQHYLSRHTEERCHACDVKDCEYVGKTRVHLRRHMQSHQVPSKLFRCMRCDFKTRYSSHLTRHHATHQDTEENFYFCPHCDYKCNLLDNLRKHVMKTAKHKGRFLYECSECNVGTNITNEYRDHLISMHNAVDVDLNKYFYGKKK